MCACLENLDQMTQTWRQGNHGKDMETPGKRVGFAQRQRISALICGGFAQRQRISALISMYHPQIFSGVLGVSVGIFMEQVVKKRKGNGGQENKCESQTLFA